MFEDFHNKMLEKEVKTKWKAKTQMSELDLDPPPVEYRMGARRF